MIKFIEVDKIYSHPDNPRKELGDLTELAESIGNSGILQNLTVIPWFSVGNRREICQDESMEDKYVVVIGHRRLAAAKLAGLTEVPCVITDMDHKTQVATMLSENMQRSDLTAYEQAQGFQLMMDLGESVSEISGKTGLSQTTVRSRIKLIELDQDKLKESVERGGTLKDYMELEKIKDIKRRNKVLEKIGTNDFNWSLKNAIDEEKRQKTFLAIIEKLEEFAELKTEKRGNLKHVEYFNGYGNDEVIKPKDADKVKYFYGVGPAYITLYKENIEADESTNEDEKERIKREKKAARKAALKEISDRAYNLRVDFIKKLSNTKARKNMDAIIEGVLYAMAESYSSLDYEEMADIVGIDDKEEIEWKDIAGQIWKQPELNLLTATYYTLDSPNENYYSWNCEYLQNEDLDYVYDFLKKLGYKMSEEEKQLQDGTHESFKDDENKGE